VLLPDDQELSVTLFQSVAISIERYKSTLTNSNDPRLEGLPASRMQVACFQDLTRTLRASVAQKSFACIRQHDLSGFVHRCPRRHLRASVSETTLACIHFQGSLDTNMCIRTSETLVLTTGFLHLEISPLFPDLKMNSIWKWDHLNYSTLCTKQRKFPLSWNFLRFVHLKKQSGVWR